MFHLFQSSVAASVFMLQVASVLSRCCIYFYTYVASVSSRCFICFRCMLRSSVFTLHVFDVVRRVTGRGVVMVAQHGRRRTGHDEPVVGGRGAQCAGGQLSGA